MAVDESPVADDILWLEDPANGGGAIPALQEALDQIWRAREFPLAECKEIKIIVGTSKERLDTLRALRDATVGSKELKMNLLRRSTLMESLLSYVTFFEPRMADDTKTSMRETRLLAYGIFLSLANVEEAELLLYKPYHHQFLMAVETLLEDANAFTVHWDANQRKETEAAMRTLRLLYVNIQILDYHDRDGSTFFRSSLDHRAKKPSSHLLSNTVEGDSDPIHRRKQTLDDVMHHIHTSTVCDKIYLMFEKCRIDKWTTFKNDPGIYPLINITEPACDLISACFHSPVSQALLLREDFQILKALLDLTLSTVGKSTDNVLGALAALVLKNSTASDHFMSLKALDGRTGMEVLAHFSRTRAISTRKLAIICRVNIVNSSAVFEKDEELRAILSSFGPLLDDTLNIKEIGAFGEIACTLAYLIQGSDFKHEHLQKLAYEFDLAKPLMQYLVRAHDTSAQTYFCNCAEEGVILALWSMMMNLDSIRDNLVAHGIVPLVVQAASSSDPGVVLAACQSIQILGRSIKILRTQMEEHGTMNVVMKVVETNEHCLVKASALGALCNLVTAYAPMKKSFMEAENFVHVKKCLYSDCRDVRLAAMTVFVNMSLYVGCQMKERLGQVLGWDEIVRFSLGQDDLAGSLDACVRKTDWGSQMATLALKLIQNLATGKQTHVELVANRIGIDQLLSIVEHHLIDQEKPSVEAIWVISNLSQRYFQEIIERIDLLQAVIDNFENGEEESRKAAVNCLHNLLRGPRLHPNVVSKVYERLGVKEKLLVEREETDCELQDRVKDVLDFLV